MTQQQFYNTTSKLLDELFTFKEDKDKRHISAFWNYAHQLKDFIDGLEKQRLEERNKAF